MPGWPPRWRATGKPVDGERLTIDALRFASGDSELRLLVGGQWWQWDGKAEACAKASAPKSTAAESKATPREGTRLGKKGRPRRNNNSPDGKWVAYAEGSNLFLRTAPPPATTSPAR